MNIVFYLEQAVTMSIKPSVSHVSALQYMHCDHSMTDVSVCVCLYKKWERWGGHVPVALSVLQQVELVPLGLQFGSTGYRCCELLGLESKHEHVKHVYHFIISFDIINY